MSTFLLTIVSYLIYLLCKLREKESTMKKREVYREDSNNRDNANKNLCVLAVAKAFEVDDTVHYLHTMTDLIRAVRNKFVARSRLSATKAKTVGAMRKDLPNKVDAIAFIIHVQGHVLLLDGDGKTIVDTDPRVRDKRKVKSVYAVFNPLNYDLRVNKDKNFTIEKITC